MSGLRLIADDLTGALDSSCAFASESNPVLIGLPWQPLPAGPLVAVSTETRDRDSDVAGVTAAVHHLMRDGRHDTLWFKKIDSVMRGNPIGETMAAYRAGGFNHCVFAPAFPDLGRITAGGQQFILDAGTGERRPTGPELTTAFRAHGVNAEVRDFDAKGQARPLRDAATGISIVDAETQAQLLSRIAALVRQIPGQPLWVGTGGLASALSGSRTHSIFPPVRALIVGTRHAATLAQIEHARSADAVATCDVTGGDQGLPVLVAPSLHAENAAETHRALRRLVPAIGVSDPATTAIFVIGGDTLSTVLQSVGAEFLECIGEAATGVPVCRIQGGRWGGITLLSKSGGFGSDSAVTALLARRSSAPPETGSR